TIIEVEVENGVWLFKLGNVLEEKGISKNKIMRDTNTKHDTLQGYVNGTLKRVDIDVLDRFCKYLECELIDIIEYIKK
ncbi:MAG: helix-turn-helix domain-containing protein, partial [Floccifex sp.]